MIAWNDRPVDEGALFNPAFCGLLIRIAGESHQRDTNSPIQYASAFLILPIVLHRRTRNLLPRKISTTMHAWLEGNPSVRVGFAERAAALSDVTRESLLLGAQQGWLRLSGSTVTAEKFRLSPALQTTFTDEVKHCAKASGFVGRWIALNGDPVAIYSLWGIRP